jgi:tetratricopeptide (TPR) repeat protein
MTILNRLSHIFLALTLTSCGHSQAMKTAMKPKIDFSVQDKYLKHLSPVFNPLSQEELSSPWGKEYQIGLAFAKRLDLYQAITSFKRADILISESEFNRKAEIQYQIVNCYYLGKKYYDVVDTFENSVLANTDKNFIGFHDLLIILVDSYLNSENPERANWILRKMKKFYPIDAKKLELTTALLHADLFEMKQLGNAWQTEKEIDALCLKLPLKENQVQFVNDPEILSSQIEQEKEIRELKHLADCQTATGDVLKAFNRYKKNPSLAGFLNAAIPGLGYLYIGQKQSAFTAFCLNALFISSTGYFFYKGNYPAGVITLSFETGWYLGGILGAKEGAMLYNERLFETHAHYQMRDHKLFPILMLQHGF